ncbi:hypothetical protein BGZ79_008740 [Entomortierella chlamydospora]|nr:hypothetical protein BGZ79_008740 [Entomortierella chlamydospora]
MLRPSLQPKDALVLCTVSVLFIYFGLVLWTNYAIIVPYWTPLFWAAALSVPLHSLKSRLLPPLHEAFENDIMDIVASALGGVIIFVIRFFLGSYVANAIKAIFRGYCYIVYIICDGRSRSTNKTGLSGDGDDLKEDQWEQDTKDGPYYKRASEYDMDGTQLDKLSEDDFELRPRYQTLVDQEPDKYARPANWPSYVDLLRAALIYVVLQWTTPTELWDFVKTLWSEVQFGTLTQLTYLILAIIVHMEFVCMKQVVRMAERVFYPGLTPEELEERSILTAASRVIRRAIQESLNSMLATTIVLSTLSILGVLVTILSVGVAHDIQGLLVQTHHRVANFRYEQVQGLQGDHETGYASASKNPLLGHVDEALSQAYDAGIDWFDPILKEAFPNLAWGATDWAYHVANIVVDVDQQETIVTPRTPVDTRKVDIKKNPEIEEVMVRLSQAANQIPFTDDDKLDSAASRSEEDIVLEKPELWVIPTLESLGISGIKTESTGEFTAQKQSQKAINISQINYLLGIVLGYGGFDTPAMLSGFNTFNDLLFRWILFLLGLLTFTGLKVSPLQRVGWIVDQALAPPESNFGSSKLSASASPGRSIAKSIEFAISGTFVSMFKLSIYHTIFTIIWTRFLSRQVMPLIEAGAASSDFVAVKYAWLTSLLGIVLILFPIAPNWLVSLPGAIIHFYIYGQRSMEAIALVMGHVVMASMVDGAVWDSHVIKSARPGVSSAFWLGLWVFLGGMKWGPKGLLLGPVLFAAVPSIWSALLELRGRPNAEDGYLSRRVAPGFSREFAPARFARTSSVEMNVRSRETRRRYRREDYESDEEYESRRRNRASSSSKSRSRSSGRKLSNGRRR